MEWTKTVNPNSKSLAASCFSAAKNTRFARPVEEVEPPFCGVLDMEINATAPVLSAPRLAAFGAGGNSLRRFLIREDDDYFLDHAVEKGRASRSKNAPFVASDFEFEGKRHRTRRSRSRPTLGYRGLRAPNLPIRIERWPPETGEPAPYVTHPPHL